MNRHKLFWKVYPYYFTIIVLSLILTALYASNEMRTMYYSELAKTLDNRAELIKQQLKHAIANQDNQYIDRQCKLLGQISETRITIIDTLGVVLGDSDKNPAGLENHQNRPEISQAYAGSTGVETRYSNTLQMTLMYVAKPVYQNDRIIGIIRTSLSVSSIEATLNKFYTNVAISGFLITLLATVISIFVFKRLTNPLKELQARAEQFAQGNLKSKIPASDITEIATLSSTMNKMAEQLDSRIRTIIDQRNEREAIFASMTEGVIALDAKDHIVAINQAAIEFMKIDRDQSLLKPIYEVIRIAELHEFVNKTVKSTGKVEMEFILPAENKRYFQAHGTALLDSTGKRIGVVLVFNDITRLKKLENVRREFVANVSHELKTPITAIIGSAETLLVNTPENSKDLKRFLEIIANHSDRLNSLVDDLLTLARIESEGEQGVIPLAKNRLFPVIESAIQACQMNSNLKNIKIVLKCDPYIEANYNSHQLEQSIINLIDNAIKYSEPDTTIFINIIAFSDEIVISVEDQGAGIEKKHLPRLFERFYRIDKGRSRDVGGTGLGLAIVKHIALAHGGKVSVDSEIGQGSKFRIHLPS